MLPSLYSRIEVSLQRITGKKNNADKIKIVFFALHTFGHILYYQLNSFHPVEAVAGNLENYIKRLTKLEEIAKSFDGVEKSYAIQAGREIRIMVKPEVVSDDRMPLVARDIVKKIEDELEYPGQIKVHIVRESRAIDYAK